MGELLLLIMQVHINESSMANILHFAEVSNIEGVHINMNTSKEKVMNVHIKVRKIIHFKVCTEGLFYTNLDDPSIFTNHTTVSVNA